MIEIREEKISEQRETENVVREAFWNVYSPGCSDHYLVHQIRQCPAYIPQLNLVAVKNETIVGHVINIKSYISGDDGRNYEVISLGPISVLPQYQRTGVGSKLISEVKKIAKQSGYRAILLYGNPAFYLQQGFEPAEKYCIRNSENMFAAALHICGLSDGALDGINGKYYENLRNLYQVHYRSNIFSKYLLNVSHLRIISPWIVLLRLSILKKPRHSGFFFIKHHLNIF